MAAAAAAATQTAHGTEAEVVEGGDEAADTVEEVVEGDREKQLGQIDGVGVAAGTEEAIRVFGSRELHRIRLT